MVVQALDKQDSMFSKGPVLPSFSRVEHWDSRDHLEAHYKVRRSGLYNFEGCRIPVPTAIRYDRIRESLGDLATPKDLRMISLLKYGMPIGCKANYGIRKPQKKHFSALMFKDEVSSYFSKSVLDKAILGPFKSSPIADLCFSPLMTVPK